MEYKKIKENHRTLKTTITMLIVVLTLTFTLSALMFAYEEKDEGTYKIHFLNVIDSDAILIESNGKLG